MRFEGLSLTVADVERSLGFYRDKLGIEAIYVSLPAFAMLRAGAGTIGLLSREEAAREGVVAASAEQARGVHVEFTTDDDPDGHSVEFAQGRRGSDLKPRPES